MEQPRGMTAFTVVWFGQVLSLLGSAMTAFALTIWAFEETGQATALALVAFFSFGPTVLLSPVAGALVDRWNRRLVMMFSDLAAGLSTIVVLILFATGQLEVWHLYVTGAFAGAFQAFQFPAYSAAVTMMLPKEQYARASGMLSLAQSASGVLAPAAAGALLGPVGIVGILLVDIVTFIAAVGTLLFVHIPQPKAAADDEENVGSLWQESVYGFRYIYRRPSLLALQMVFFFMNFISAFTLVLLSPMISGAHGQRRTPAGRRTIDWRRRRRGGRPRPQRLGRPPAADQRRLVGHVRCQPAWSTSIRDRSRPALMGRRQFRHQLHGPRAQRLQPGHLAGQGRS